MEVTDPESLLVDKYPKDNFHNNFHIGESDI